MTPKQRWYHVVIWLLILVSLPVVGSFGVHKFPVPVLQETVTIEPVSKEKIIETGCFMYRFVPRGDKPPAIRAAGDSNIQLSFTTIHQIANAPFTGIHLVTPTDTIPLEAVTNFNLYRRTLPWMQINEVIFMDELSESIILSKIEFEQ